MNSKKTKILMVEDDTEYAQLVGDALALTGVLEFEITLAGRLRTALECLVAEPFDAILLDLGLPDSKGLDTFSAVYAQAPGIPTLVLTANTDETTAIQAVREGAQDYLVKNQLTPPSLARAIRNAIERHHAWAAVERLSMLDELTGLYNRRGFYSLAEQHLKLSRRTGRKMLLFFADLDGLKQINDTFGHREGDQALRLAAEILRSTFRSSDIICRLGGDEFMVLAIDAKEGAEAALNRRLQENIERSNQRDHPIALQLSWGVARFDPQQDIQLDALVDRADQALYEHKRGKGRAD